MHEVLGSKNSKVMSATANKSICKVRYKQGIVHSSHTKTHKQTYILNAIVLCTYSFQIPYIQATILTKTAPKIMVFGTSEARRPAWPGLRPPSQASSGLRPEFWGPGRQLPALAPGFCRPSQGRPAGRVGLARLSDSLLVAC